jgi:hypothetical protein
MLTRQGAMMRIAPSTTVRMLSFTENPVVFVRVVLFPRKFISQLTGHVV